MQKKLIDFNKKLRDKNVPDLRSGDVVKVYRKIVEGGKERIQIFEGSVIAIKGGQSSSPTITVRKISSGFGVELILPVHSPKIEKIELVKRARTKRSKLYYVREKTAKSLKFKYKDVLASDNPREEKTDPVVAVEEKNEKEVNVEKVEDKK